MVSHRSLPDPHVVKLQTRVNDHLVQNGAAEKMIFSIPQWVVFTYLSRTLTLVSSRISRKGLPSLLGRLSSPEHRRVSE